MNAKRLLNALVCCLLSGAAALADTPEAGASPEAGFSNPNCSVCIEGAAAYTLLGTGVRLQAARIQNTTSSVRGPMYVELWATARNTYGSAVDYTLMASYRIGFMGGGARITDLDVIVPYIELPPSGCYYIAMVLFEEGRGYRDWRLFTECYRRFGSSSGNCCDDPFIQDDAFEPNNSCGEARFVTLGTRSLQWQNPDWFEVEIAAQQALRAELTYNRNDRDLDLELRGTDCGAVLARVTSPDGAEVLTWTNASGNARRVRLGVLLNSGGFGPYSLTLGQVAGCIASLAPAATGYPAEGGAGTATVTIAAGCPWSASTTANWIALTSASGVGNGLVRYVVAPNPGTTARTGSIVVDGQAHTITQAGAGSGCQVRLVDVTATANAAPLRTLDGSQWTFRTVPSAFDPPVGSLDGGLVLRLNSDSGRGTYGSWESVPFGPLPAGRYEIEVRLDPIGPLPPQTNYPELRIRLQTADGLDSALRTFRSDWANPARAYPSALVLPYTSNGAETLRLSIDLLDVDPSVVAGGHRVVGFSLRQVTAFE